MNKFIGIGRLTKNPEVRYTNNKNGEQMAIARYTIAIDRIGRTMEGHSSADFINCVAFGRQGEFAEKYLKQGTKIAVEGRIQTDSYTNKDGQKVYTTDIVVDRHEFCESKAQSGGNEAQESKETPPNAPDDYLNVPDDIADNLPWK